jgi:hypothetical protein
MARSQTDTKWFLFCSFSPVHFLCGMYSFILFFPFHSFEYLYRVNARRIMHGPRLHRLLVASCVLYIKLSDSQSRYCLIRTAAGKSGPAIRSRQSISVVRDSRLYFHHFFSPLFDGESAEEDPATRLSRHYANEGGYVHQPFSHASTCDRNLVVLWPAG